jgi:hypothetical protein
MPTAPLVARRMASRFGLEGRRTPFTHREISGAETLYPLHFAIDNAMTRGVTALRFM